MLRCVSKRQGKFPENVALSGKDLAGILRSRARRWLTVASRVLEEIHKRTGISKDTLRAFIPNEGEKVGESGKVVAGIFRAKATRRAVQAEQTGLIGRKKSLNRPVSRQKQDFQGSSRILHLGKGLSRGSWGNAARRAWLEARSSRRCRRRQAIMCYMIRYLIQTTYDSLWQRVRLVSVQMGTWRRGTTAGAGGSTQHIKLLIINNLRDVWLVLVNPADRPTRCRAEKEPDVRVCRLAALRYVVTS